MKRHESCRTIGDAEQGRLQSAIRGKIADTVDCPVVLARVEVSGAELEEKRCATTGREGHFLFNGIPPGIYTLEVDCSGFSRLVQRGIAVQKNAITGLNMKMDFQEDSRSLKLRSLNLDYVHEVPGNGGAEKPSRLAQQLSDIVAALRLDKALFHPPSVLRIGRREVVEFGVYQNLKNEIMRGLLNRRIVLFEKGEIDVALYADLQAAGCRVFPRSPARLSVGGTGYVGWRWEVLPQAAGPGLIRVDLDVRVNFGGRGEEEKKLPVFERETVIRKNRWLAAVETVKTIVGGGGSGCIDRRG